MLDQVPDVRSSPVGASRVEIPAGDVDQRCPARREDRRGINHRRSDGAQAVEGGRVETLSPLHSRAIVVRCVNRSAAHRHAIPPAPGREDLAARGREARDTRAVDAARIQRVVDVVAGDGDLPRRRHTGHDCRLAGAVDARPHQVGPVREVQVGPIRRQRAAETRLAAEVRRRRHRRGGRSVEAVGDGALGRHPEQLITSGGAHRGRGHQQRHERPGQRQHDQREHSLDDGQPMPGRP